MNKTLSPLLLACLATSSCMAEAPASAQAAPPVAPEFTTRPPTNLPIGDTRHRFPELPPGLATKPCVRPHRKYADAFCGKPEPVNTSWFADNTMLPVPEIEAATPVEFGNAVQ